MDIYPQRALLYQETQFISSLLDIYLEHIYHASMDGPKAVESYVYKMLFRPDEDSGAGPRIWTSVRGHSLKFANAGVDKLEHEYIRVPIFGDLLQDRGSLTRELCNMLWDGNVHVLIVRTFKGCGLVAQSYPFMGDEYLRLEERVILFGDIELIVIEFINNLSVRSVMEL
jgi:hypothetical protein